MASAGLRALLARATARVRVPAGARAATESPGWRRSLIARMKARFRSTADARQGGGAASGSAPSTGEGRSKILNKDSKGAGSPNKARTKKISSTEKEKPSTLKLKSPKSKGRLLNDDLQVTNEREPKPSKLEKFVVTAERNASLAVRFSKVLKDAGAAFTNIIQAGGAVVFGTSMFVFHRDKLCENYQKLKDLFPTSATTSGTPATPPVAPPAASAIPPEAPGTASGSPPEATASS